MRSEWSFVLALWSVMLLAILNLVWTLVWMGVGPLTVFVLYGAAAYVLSSRRYIPTRFAVGVVAFALFLELLEVGRIGWDNLGRVDLWLLGAHLALVPVFLSSVYRMNRALQWAKRGTR